MLDKNYPGNESFTITLIKVINFSFKKILKFGANRVPLFCLGPHLGCLCLLPTGFPLEKILRAETVDRCFLNNSLLILLFFVLFLEILRGQQGFFFGGGAKVVVKGVVRPMQQKASLRVCKGQPFYWKMTKVVPIIKCTCTVFIDNFKHISANSSI